MLSADERTSIFHPLFELSLVGEADGSGIPVPVCLPPPILLSLAGDPAILFGSLLLPIIGWTEVAFERLKGIPN